MNNTYFQQAKFTGSYPACKDLPADEGSEIAFCGRSNCGKSSVLNALTNNKKLAKTSKTPGRTQAINVFEIGSAENFKIIDFRNKIKWKPQIDIKLQRLQKEPN